MCKVPLLPCLRAAIATSSVNLAQILEPLAASVEGSTPSQAQVMALRIIRASEKVLQVTVPIYIPVYTVHTLTIIITVDKAAEGGPRPSGGVRVAVPASIAANVRPFLSSCLQYPGFTG